MKTVLVAIDGSKNGLRALKFALDSTQHSSARVRLLYVQPKIDRSWLLQQGVIEEHYQQQTKVATSEALRMLARRKVKANWDMVLGDPATTIVAYARQHRCSQIVLGNRGHSAVAGLFLGSVALKVVQLSDLPVTLVK
jgi:nucleotide-binding universal stress UspA family protein